MAGFLFKFGRACRWDLSAFVRLVAIPAVSQQFAKLA